MDTVLASLSAFLVALVGGGLWYKLGQLEQAIKNHTEHVHLEICTRLDRIEAEVTALVRGR